MMNSCCNNTLMSAAYARWMGITVEQGGGSTLQAAMADGTVCASHGTCKVRLKLQQLSADLMGHEVELADPYEVILGEDWLSKYSATLSWAHKCCVLTKGSQRITFVPNVSSQDEPAQSHSGAFAAPMSAVQASRCNVAWLSCICCSVH